MVRLSISGCWKISPTFNVDRFVNVDNKSRSVKRFLLHKKSDVNLAPTPSQTTTTSLLYMYTAHHLCWQAMFALDLELSSMIVIPLGTGLSQC